MGQVAGQVGGGGKGGCPVRVPSGHHGEAGGGGPQQGAPMGRGLEAEAIRCTRQVGDGDGLAGVEAVAEQQATEFTRGGACSVRFSGEELLQGGRELQLCVFCEHPRGLL